MRAAAIDGQQPMAAGQERQSAIACRPRAAGTARGNGYSIPSRARGAPRAGQAGVSCEWERRAMAGFDFPPPLQLPGQQRGASAPGQQAQPNIYRAVGPWSDGARRNRTFHCTHTARAPRISHPELLEHRGPALPPFGLHSARAWNAASLLHPDDRLGSGSSPAACREQGSSRPSAGAPRQRS